MFKAMTTLRIELNKIAEGDHIMGCSLNEEELNREFNIADYSRLNFVAWSKRFIYYPAQKDNRITRVPRGSVNDSALMLWQMMAGWFAKPKKRES